MNVRKGILLTALLAALCMGIGGTMAYLTDRTPQIVNTLQPGKVPPHIVEEFDGHKYSAWLDNDYDGYKSRRGNGI